MKNILALDLGTKTGVAVYTKHNKSIKSNTQCFKTTRFESSDRRFIKFKTYINSLRQLYEIEEVYFEEVRRHRGVDAAHMYGGWKATLTAWCLENDISYQGVPVGTIKKHATGNGRASKEEMIEAMVKRGHSVKDDNEADALALLYYALELD